MQGGGDKLRDGVSNDNQGNTNTPESRDAGGRGGGFLNELLATSYEPKVG